MIATVAKWGNSLALRIPTAFAREISAREGMQLDISVVDGTLVLKPVADTQDFSLDQLLDGITPESLHGEISGGPSVGNEA